MCPFSPRPLFAESSRKQLDRGVLSLSQTITRKPNGAIFFSIDGAEYARARLDFASSDRTVTVDLRGNRGENQGLDPSRCEGLDRSRCLDAAQ